MNASELAVTSLTERMVRPSAIERTAVLLVERVPTAALASIRLGMMMAAAMLVEPAVTFSVISLGFTPSRAPRLWRNCSWAAGLKSDGSPGTEKLAVTMSW